MIKVFFLEPVARARLSLRRYVGSDELKCPNFWLHDNSVVIGEIDYPINDMEAAKLVNPNIPHEDPRWPTHCGHCDFTFRPEDAWQNRVEPLYKRGDNGELTTLHDAPEGAMWYANWFSPHYQGPDGNVLIVRCPGRHDWMVDSTASNCDMPCKNCGVPYHNHPPYSKEACKYEEARPHKCWVRHGDPRTGDVHVDKNGNTCGAGAGSILYPGWHGFLHNGYLTTC